MPNCLKNETLRLIKIGRLTPTLSEAKAIAADLLQCRAYIAKLQNKENNGNGPEQD